MSDNLFSRILVPTDLTSFTDLALRFAALFRQKMGAEITVLHAHELSPAVFADHPLGVYFEVLPEATEAIRTRLEEFARTHLEGLAPELVIVDSHPVPAIIETADAIKADAIIMGTHGRQGFRRAFLGSVTERVLRETLCPVITVTPDLFPGDEVSIRKILCPLNFTEVAREALEMATAVAAGFNAELIVMHVAGGLEPAMSVSGLEERFTRWLDPAIKDQVTFHQVIVSGDAAPRILELAETSAADLLVIGAQHKRFSDATVLGSTTERITRFARRPVMTVIRREDPYSEAATA